MFRLPVGWQYLVNNKVGGPIGGQIAETFCKEIPMGS